MAGCPKNVISMLQMVHIHIALILSKISSLRLEFGKTINKSKFYYRYETLTTQKSRLYWSLTIYVNESCSKNFLTFELLQNGDS